MTPQTSFPLLLMASMLLFRNVFAAIPSPDSYWQVTPQINYTDVLYAGWDPITVETEVLVYNGSLLNRTYAHHPQLLAVNNTIYLVHSSAVIDEDSMGMELWGSISLDGGHTWTPSQSLLPAALLPNQTDVANFSYWCNEAIWQRAIGGLAVLPLSDDTVWGIGETTNYFCWGTIGSGTRGAGRIARQMSPLDGSPLSDPCWLNQNNWTYIEGWNETVYGTEYGMKFCEKADEMNALLEEPTNVPAWSAWLYNNQLYAADNKSSMQEVTHAIWIEDVEGGYWQRFWRDISPVNNSMRVWVETSRDETGEGWYPVIEEAFSNQVFETNIPDAKTKQFLGVLENSNRYLISNPRNNSELIRQPLTIAMSFGLDLSYKSVGVLRTNASSSIVPDTRDYKNQGFSYPVAVQVGNHVVVAYSENKENIWASVVDIDDLPGVSESQRMQTKKERGGEDLKH